MTTRVALDQMTAADQAQVRAWANEWGALVQSVWRPSRDEYRAIEPRPERRRRRAPLMATLFRTIDGHQMIGPDGWALTFDVEIPDEWADRFPIIIGPGAGITATNLEDKP